MKKIFYLILLVSICPLKAQDADDLLSNTLSKDLIDSCQKNDNHEKVAQDITTKKSAKNENKKEKTHSDTVEKTSLTDKCDHRDHIWNLMHEEMKNFSEYLENSFKIIHKDTTKKQFTIEDKDNLIIIKIALPHNLSMEKAMLDIIDNKHFKMNLNGDDSKVVVSGLITQNIIHVAVYSETKQVNKKGEARTSSHESSVAHPLMGRIQDLENNIKAEYSSDTHEMIITLHKETHKKHSIKVITR